MAFHLSRPRLTLPAAVSLTLASLACTDVPVGPEDQGALELFESGNFSDAASELNGRAASVRVVLDGERLLARRVRIGTPVDKEEIEGRVTALDLTASGGTVAIAPGLSVQFTGETEFEIGEEEATREVFMARLAALLAEGAAWIEAERGAPTEPQSPDNASFVAAELSLHRSGGHTELRLNVDGDNLTRNPAPPPDGWLNALGLMIELRVTEGLTLIEIENGEIAKREFSGTVHAVNLAARTLTLEGGITVRLVEETEIGLRAEHGLALRTLEAAAQALDAGFTVSAAGFGAVETEEPLTVIAFRLVLLLRAEAREFQGRVTAVDLTARTFTLEGGKIVRLFAGTIVLHEIGDVHRFATLEAVAEALAQGRSVIAAGTGAPVPGVTGTLLALKVSFAPPLERFDGAVASVDLDAASVTLDDGTVVRVPEGSIHHELGNRGEVLTSLDAVAEALAAGKKVLAAGLGVVESRDPLTLVAVRVVFFVAPPPLQRFEGIVQSVDLEHHSVTLKSGALIRVPEGAIHNESGDGNTFHTLADVAAAIAAGKTVLAVGAGTVETGEPLVIVAVKVMFVAQPPGLIRFDGIVTAVNLEAGSVTLKSGTVVRITEETTIHDETDGDHMLGSLEQVAEALRDGKTVSVVGVGEVESHDPLVIVAHDVAFLLKPPVFVFFTGTVASVNLDARRLQLEDGTMVVITAGTQIVADDHTLPSLHAVAEALGAGRTVVAAGVGMPLAGEGDVYEAVKIVFVVSS